MYSYLQRDDPAFEERQQKMIEMRKNGATYREVAEAVGLTRARVWDLIGRGGFPVNRNCTVCGTPIQWPRHKLCGSPTCIAARVAHHNKAVSQRALNVRWAHLPCHRDLNAFNKFIRKNGAATLEEGLAAYRNQHTHGTRSEESN